MLALRAAALVAAQDMPSKQAVAACTRGIVQNLWLSGPLYQQCPSWTLSRHPYSAQTAAQTQPSSSKSALESAMAKRERMVATLDFKNAVLGKVMDPYMRRKSFREAGALSSFSGLKMHLANIWQNFMMQQQAMTTARSAIPEFTSQGLLEEVADLYLQLQRAQADMQPDLVRPIVSHDIFIKLRNEVDQRRRKGWHQIDWQLLDEGGLVKRVKQVQARSHKLLPASPYSWLQFTFSIQSKQRFAAYSVDSLGRKTLVAGNPDQDLDVLEYCVFERKVRMESPSVKQVLKGPRTALEGSRWRFIGWVQP